MSHPKPNGAPTLHDNAHQDAWENVLTGVGTADRDKRTAGRPLRPATNSSFTRWDDLYHGDDVARRIVEVFPREMTREWVSLKVEDKKDADGVRTEEDVETRAATADDIMQALEDLGAQQAMFSGLVWGRVFGGGLIFMGIDDGGGMDPESMRKPLNEDRIKSFSHINVFDRFEVQVTEWYADPTHPKFGTPMIYQIVGHTVPGGQLFPTQNAFVHESRFLIFDGVHTSRRRRVANWGWGDSIFTSLCEVIRDFGLSWASVTSLLQDFAQAVWKSKVCPTRSNTTRKWFSIASAS